MHYQDLFAEADELLENNAPEWIDLYHGYADTILRKTEDLKILRGQFREWKPLRVYMSVNDILKNDNAVSLRYMGQEVAKVVIQKRPDQNPAKTEYEVRLQSIEEKQKLDALEFKWPQAGYYAWDSQGANAFRTKIKTAFKADLTSEAALESLIIDEMEKPTRDKFLGTLKNIQPVKLLGTYRYQMIVPLSAHTGKPAYKKGSWGHIDILARLGTGAKVSLGIIELKKDKRTAYKSAIAQSLVYAFCVLRILRTPQLSDKWFEIFGFKRKGIPEKLTVFAIPMLPSALSDLYAKEARALGLQQVDHEVSVGEDSILCRYLFFEEEKDSKHHPRIKITSKNLL